MSWNYFVVFAIVAVMLWITGALAAWKGKPMLVFGATIMGLVVFFSYIVLMWVALERPSIAHNGRNTAVVFFLFAPYRYRCVFTLALSVDIIFLYCVGYSVRLCEHFQAGNTQ